MNEPRKTEARTQLVLIALVFALPMALAAWLYFGNEELRPEGRSNHGALLAPVLPLADELPADNALLEATRGQWALIFVQEGECADACRDALYRQRQVRLMLGNDMSRVRRVLLHGPVAPDKVFLADEHAGLIALQDGAAARLLELVRPRGAARGGLYFSDPLGNVVMYFAPDIAPRELVEDVEHLLKISRIG